LKHECKRDFKTAIKAYLRADKPFELVRNLRDLKTNGSLADYTDDDEDSSSDSSNRSEGSSGESSESNSNSENEGS
jgi:hypothetical protein